MDEFYLKIISLSEVKEFLSREFSKEETLELKLEIAVENEINALFYFCKNPKFAVELNHEEEKLFVVNNTTITHYWSLEYGWYELVKPIQYITNPPKFTHDCNNCKFLGCYDVPFQHQYLVKESDSVDLYFCSQLGSLNTIIARFDNEGPDYISGLCLIHLNPILKEGYDRAVELEYM